MAHCSGGPHQQPSAAPPLLSSPSYTAAEYWQWAAKVSPEDLSAAEAMVAEVRAYLPSLDDPERRNTERMRASLKR
ncbi:hypothetical protein [Corallococcus caeni]|uniref:Uncharacterized protein n=1 Tax=Corallococcus caeni TaxID=3082388 RepID=A0ABQ6QY01_9BACT|nr:hypothetical protein ASNO1_44410 [Corallococcus sp. NO1]